MSGPMNAAADMDILEPPVTLSVLLSFGVLTARGNVTVSPMASVMTLPDNVPATITVGVLTVRMRVFAKKASVTKRRASAHATLAPGAPCATTTATAASTQYAMR